MHREDSPRLGVARAFRVFADLAPDNLVVICLLWVFSVGWLFAVAMSDSDSLNPWLLIFLLFAMALITMFQFIAAASASNRQTGAIVPVSLLAVTFPLWLVPAGIIGAVYGAPLISSAFWGLGLFAVFGRFFAFWWMSLAAVASTTVLLGASPLFSQPGMFPNPDWSVLVWHGLHPIVLVVSAARVMDHERWMRGRCPHCGYSLAGLQAKTCPECGQDQELSAEE